MKLNTIRKNNQVFGIYSISDHNGHKDKAFVISGSNDTDAKSATTTLTTPGFKGKEHPRECLNFWYNIKV